MKYLVLENNYTALTVNSIEQNMPDAEYKVVPIEGGKIPTALKHCTGTNYGCYGRYSFKY